MSMCPCGSGKELKECCLPYHLGTAAPDAERLMRSRYSAYAVGNIDYILRTTHPNNPDAKKPLPQRRKEAKAFSEATTFEKLEVLEFEPGETQATVTFHARLRQGNEDVSFTEKSLFEKIDDQWLYLKSLDLRSE